MPLRQFGTRMAAVAPEVLYWRCVAFPLPEVKDKSRCVQSSFAAAGLAYARLRDTQIDRTVSLSVPRSPSASLPSSRGRSGDRHG